MRSSVLREPGSPARVQHGQQCRDVARPCPPTNAAFIYPRPQFAGGSGAGQAGGEGGALLASGGQDGQLYVWHLQLDEEGEAIHESQKLHASFVKEGGGEFCSSCLGWPTTRVLACWYCMATCRAHSVLLCALQTLGSCICCTWSILPSLPTCLPPSTAMQPLLVMCSCRGTPPASGCLRWARAVASCWWRCRWRAWSSWSLTWTTSPPQVHTPQRMWPLQLLSSCRAWSACLHACSIWLTHCPVTAWLKAL